MRVDSGQKEVEYGGLKYVRNWLGFTELKSFDSKSSRCEIASRNWGDDVVDVVVIDFSSL